MFILLGCSSSKETKEGNGNDKGSGERIQDDPKKAVPKVSIREEGWEKESSAPFQVEKVGLKEEQLQLQVRYSGGCEEHSFELVTRKEYSKSQPPVLNLVLLHDNNGDACRSVITDSLAYDISALQHPDSDELLLQLEDYDRSIRYEY